MRDVRESVTFDEAWEKFKKATKILDRISCRGIVHKNYAGNKKSSLAKYINTLKASKA